ncbi:SIS domain-containing protein, partial [Collinsella sp. AF11-11]
MKETEKIEIMHFSQEGYVEDGKNVYETGKKMTALADKVA